MSDVEKIRGEADARVARELAEAQAVNTARAAEAATQAREVAEAEQMEAAKQRAQRRMAEEEREQAEQQHVDDLLAAEKEARKNADAAGRAVKKGSPGTAAEGERKQESGASAGKDDPGAGKDDAGKGSTARNLPGCTAGERRHNPSLAVYLSA